MCCGSTGGGHTLSTESEHTTPASPRALEAARLSEGSRKLAMRTKQVSWLPTLQRSLIEQHLSYTIHPTTRATQAATQKITMADDKNNTEAKEASPFANTTFSFTAPQGGASAPFPNLAGFSQALASAAEGAREEDDEPLAPEVQVRKK